MKIIDLWNKIANDRKIPERIKFNEYEYQYHDKEHGYCRSSYDCTYICLDSEYYLFDILNEEVEILEEKKTPTLNDTRESYGLSRIEEKKIPEKLYLSDYEDTTGKFDYDVLLTINEIIDYLQYLKSKGDE